MTTMITMEDVRRAIGNETRITYVEVRPKKAIMTWDWWRETLVTGMLWLGVLMIALPLGMLLEAIYDTVRWGHPR